jgi:TonB family protein
MTNWQRATTITVLLFCILLRAQTPTTASVNFAGRSVGGVPADAQSVAPVKMSAQLILKPLPDYPRLALQAQAGGFVSVLILIGKDGHVEDILATDGPAQLIDDSKAAIRQWTYQPYLLDGQPARVVTTAFLIYRLATATSAPSVAMVPAIPRISGAVAAGNMLHHPNPIYPEKAKAKHIGGTVILRALIDEQGNVANLTAFSGPEELRGAAIDTVRKWIYKPYILNGSPTPIDTTITINFDIFH